MPNHITNIIYAPRHVLESLINDNGHVDFNMIAPFEGTFEWNGVFSSSELAAEVAINAPLSENELIAELERANRKDVNVLEMNDEAFEQFVQMLRNKRQHGFFHTMDFARAKWGTKWNAYSQKLDIDEGVVQFETAWSCPVALLKTLSAQHPGTEIVVKYADEDLGSNCGTLILKDGVIVSLVCAGKWRDMTGEERARWTRFASEVTGLGVDEDEEVEQQ